jgi:hypothetical protein
MDGWGWGLELLSQSKVPPNPPVCIVEKAVVVVVVVVAEYLEMEASPPKACFYGGVGTWQLMGIENVHTYLR